MLSTGAAQGRMPTCTALPGPGQAVWLSSCYTNNSQKVCKQLCGLIWPLFSEERGEWLKAGRDCSSARLLLDSRDAAANHTLKKLTFYLRGDIFFFKYIVCQILRGAGKMNKARTEREENELLEQCPWVNERGCDVGYELILKEQGWHTLSNGEKQEMRAWRSWTEPGLELYQPK